jgi:hypothetical protein
MQLDTNLAQDNGNGRSGLSYRRAGTSLHRPGSNNSHWQQFFFLSKKYFSHAKRKYSFLSVEQSPSVSACGRRLAAATATYAFFLPPFYLRDRTPTAPISDPPIPTATHPNSQAQAAQSTQQIERRGAMAVVGVLALQGSYNEHISGTLFLPLSVLVCAGCCLSSHDSVGYLPGQR